MMKQFTVKYRFGGMSLRHSAWWLYQDDQPVKFLKKSDYK
jgi:hypothetical protein